MGDGFVATLGRDAEKTPSATSKLFFFSFLSVIHQFANWEAVSSQSPLRISPAKQRPRRRQGGCEVRELPAQREAALGPGSGSPAARPTQGPPGAPHAPRQRLSEFSLGKKKKIRFSQKAAGSCVTHRL